MSITSHKLTSADGTHYTLSLTHSVDKHFNSGSAAPIVLCLPAMGVPARKYIALAEDLKQQGIISALFELRGIDSSSVRASRRNNFGFHEILNLDLPTAISFIREYYQHNPLYLLGHSLGGQLGLLYMSMNPQQINGLIGIATGIPFYRQWRFPYNLGILMMSQFMPLIAKSVGYFPGRKLGFGGRESIQLVKDWSKAVKTGRYLLAGYSPHFEAKMALLTKQTLLITIDKDVLAPQEPIKMFGERLINSEVTYHHLEEQDFQYDSLGHFNWMKEPTPITSRIVDWLEKS